MSSKVDFQKSLVHLQCHTCQPVVCIQAGHKWFWIFSIVSLSWTEWKKILKRFEPRYELTSPKSYLAKTSFAENFEHVELFRIKLLFWWGRRWTVTILFVPDLLVSLVFRWIFLSLQNTTVMQIVLCNYSHTLVIIKIRYCMPLGLFWNVNCMKVWYL